MQTNRKDSIELSLKDKNYNPTQNVSFKEVKIVKYDDLENTFRTCNYSPIQWKGNYRNEDNFISATGFVIDIDSGVTIQEAETVLTQHNLNYALVTSKSHSEALHKFHVLLPFNRKVYTIENYKTAANRIKEELFPALDTNTMDAARFMYGSKITSIYSCCFSGKNFIVDSAEQVGDAWGDDLEVTLADSSVELGINVKIQTDKTIPVHCPFHNDNSPSAFLGYSEKSFNHYIRCSSCGRTFWKIQTKDIIALKSENFWSCNTSVYEAGIIGDVFSLENIGDKKYYVKVGAKTKEDKDMYYDYLIENKHLHRLNRIDNIGDIASDESTYDFDRATGVITVRVKALRENVKDNAFVESYLDGVFGIHKGFIKEWLAVYVYSNYKKLPTLILTGKRGVGKNTFAEPIQAIFPVLSETAKDLDGNFNPFAEKKLLVIDESASNGKVQYQLLKKFSGQKNLEVNKKYLPQYQVQNNLNIIFLSNDELPIYVERDEIPTDDRNNQFFVYHMQPHNTFDADLQQKLIDRLGHYIRTELKAVFVGLSFVGYRYSIAVPITDEEKKLFNNSVTDIESEADKVIEYVESNITNPSWSYHEFVKAGYLPSAFFHDIITNYRVNKIKVIQNLQKHGYITNDKAGKYVQIKGQRPISYKLGQVWLGMVPNVPAKVPTRMFGNGHSDGQLDLSMGSIEQ
jgi:hypothetical protein